MGRGAGITEQLGQTVRAVKLTGDGLASSGPARLRGLFIAAAAGGGNLEFRDGGAAGAIKLEIQMEAIQADQYIPIPDGGIQFATNLYVNFPVGGIDAVTLFYR